VVAVVPDAMLQTDDQPFTGGWRGPGRSVVLVMVRMLFFAVVMVMPMMTGARILPAHDSSSLQMQGHVSIARLRSGGSEPGRIKQKAKKVQHKNLLEPSWLQLIFPGFNAFKS
jgi:hypothetical protein